GAAPLWRQLRFKPHLVCIASKGKLLGNKGAARVKLHGKARAALYAAMRCGAGAQCAATIKRERAGHQPVAHFAFCGNGERGEPVQREKSCRNASLSRRPVAQVK